MKLKRSSIFTKIVLLALIVYATISLVNTKNRVAEAEADRVVLQARVDAMLQENAELEYDIEHAGDPDTIAEIADTLHFSSSQHFSTSFKKNVGVSPTAKPSARSRNQRRTESGKAYVFCTYAFFAIFPACMQ